jgi:hypothetical protein
VPSAMKDGSPFGLAGLWENWRNPNTGEWERTFAIITVPSNELVGRIHNRMPITYPSASMTMGLISTRVNKPDRQSPRLQSMRKALRYSAPFSASRGSG